MGPLNWVGPERSASSSSDTSDWDRATGISLQQNLAVQPKISRWPTSVVDPGFYTTRWDVNELAAGQAFDVQGPATEDGSEWQNRW